MAVEDDVLNFIEAVEELGIPQYADITVRVGKDTYVWTGSHWDLKMPAFFSI